MKIVYITSDFLYNIGGIYQHIENITYFTAKENEVIIIYLNKNNQEEYIIDDFNRKIYFLSHNGSQLQRFFRYPASKINQIIQDEKPDIIHVHTLFEAIRLKQFPIPMVFTNHSSSYLKMYNNFFLRNIILPEVFHKFSLIIAPSTELFAKTEHHNKIMIPNGVNISRFSLENRLKVNKAKILEKYNIKIPENSLILLSTRRLVDKNGVLDFIRANVEYFKNNQEKITYLIAGAGEHYEAIKTIKQENNLANLHLLGTIDNKAVDDLYYIADLCLIPSKMEAISISALEAMAAGTIVVANKVGGLAELIEDDFNGKFLVNLDLEKAIKEITGKLDIIRINASEMVKSKYSWENIANQTMDLYKKVIS